ncbi:MAG: hypothetical protein FWH56_06340, partial [Betaproteobacteria bacterium]|nr:hypothetical protein [Betaproteobacteria bacterium]
PLNNLSIHRLSSCAKSQDPCDVWIAATSLRYALPGGVVKRLLIGAMHQHFLQVVKARFDNNRHVVRDSVKIMGCA